MDYTTVTQLISNVGFPIVAYGAMFYYMIKQDKNHKEEMDKMSEALNGNTVALRELSASINERG